MRSCILSILAVGLVLPFGASAQDSVTRFRLAEAPGNIAACSGIDAAMGREHTVTVAGGAATFRTSGGIHDKMKLLRPNVYEATFRLSGAEVDFVADLGASPRTLNVTSKNLGCRWTGQAQP